ncbi:BMP family ABC transporter substrate-binding protein [Spirochaeta africana]|uniref:Putative ABC-type transport system, periplasmic component/surface lipoprotein n=1 Tax=Spirochaeta africana (strain ATCC 700263 / DSM 8902 / Z-7692) TaxID=889378 RepID=H9UKL3_SPIAZ|nr:BMP family ABC transporter substrate-binding protein [Spirochaeta africana]AFG38056.1 putative ABC-type transport system, periplasmic component/surface lipoprotein [Spirochaeta africana DSM 8902]
MKYRCNFYLCVVTILSFFLLTAVSCTQGDDAGFHIGVFVPGYTEGSPTYELMAAGANRAAEEHADIKVSIIEGGTNQATWEESVMTMAASSRYDLIMSSNPALPDIAVRVAERVPQQRFILLDAELEGHRSIATVGYNHREQAFLNGYFAAMISDSDLRHVRAGVQLGLIAGQEFPVMNNVIKAGFREGAAAYTPDAAVDFRVVGSWNDPTKAGELARSMFSGGADVILTIAGGGNQGVITAAREAGGYVTWFDAPGYDFAPGIVLGSTVVHQDVAAYEGAVAAAAGELEFGTARIYGVREGYVGFAADHPAFLAEVPQQFRQRIIDLEQAILQGEIVPGRE